MSQKPHYLAIKVIYQGGQTEIVGMDVAQVKDRQTAPRKHSRSSNYIYADANHIQFFRLVRQGGPT